MNKKIYKKYLLSFSIVFITILMVSTVTAKPILDSELFKDKIELKEKSKKFLETTDDNDFIKILRGIVGLGVGIATCIPAFLRSILFFCTGFIIISILSALFGDDEDLEATANMCAIYLFSLMPPTYIGICTALAAEEGFIHLFMLLLIIFTPSFLYPLWEDYLNTPMYTTMLQ